MKLTKNYVILVSSCDAYFELLHHFWSSIDVPIILSTESLNYTNKYFEIINIHPKNPQCTWTERMSDTLEQIDSKYVLLILDDFFLYDKVNINKFHKCKL